MISVECIDTYCPSCDMEVHAPISARPGRISIRGEDTEFDERVAICPDCGEAIGDSRVEDGNLERAYEAYAARHGLVTPVEARELRAKYGVSVREFSRFLGFGDQTYARYEAGSLPSNTHNAVIRSAMTSAGATKLLGENGRRLSEKSVASICERIDEMAGIRPESVRRIDFDWQQSEPPSRENGYRALDMDRVAALVTTLAGRCPDLFRTKLQKAAFYCDFLACERLGRSLTGLRYARAPFGPKIDDGDTILESIERAGFVELREQGEGEVVHAVVQVSASFSEAEHGIISEVVGFVNTFSTSTGISNYSHALSCWNDTPSGMIIEYNFRHGEIGASVSARMSA